MKILIYGAGVIGCTYAWQLAEAGHDISVLVRKNKKQSIEEAGINIRCTDFRNDKKTVENIVFRPKVTDTLLPDNDFEYIIVTTNNLRLDEVLPVLKESAGKAHILFFQNMWYDDFEKIGNYLPSERYFFGFPFMAGGGRDENGINAVISGSKYSKTMLGEVNGEVTPRARKIADAMAEANMKPFISDQIATWLIPHCAFIVGFSAGIIKAGGTTEAFINNSKIVKEAVMSVRDGFHVCSKMGINPKKEKVNKLYYLPLFICIPIVKKIFGDVAMQAMFDGYLKNSTDEVKKIMDDIINCGKTHHIKMPYLTSLQEEIENR